MIAIRGVTYKVNLISLNTTSNSLLKLILNRSTLYPTFLLYKEFNIFSIEKVYCNSLLLLIYKYKYLSSKSKTRYNTRDKYNTNSNIFNRTLYIPSGCKVLLV